MWFAYMIRVPENEKIPEVVGGGGAYGNSL